mgnify:CR=1 FL=1
MPPRGGSGLVCPIPKSRTPNFRTKNRFELETNDRTAPLNARSRPPAARVWCVGRRRAARQPNDLENLLVDGTCQSNSYTAYEFPKPPDFCPGFWDPTYQRGARPREHREDPCRPRGKMLFLRPLRGRKNKCVVGFANLTLYSPKFFQRFFHRTCVPAHSPALLTCFVNYTKSMNSANS